MAKTAAGKKTSSAKGNAKKASASKKTAAKRSPKGRTSSVRTERPENNGIGEEIVLCLVWAFSILLFLSDFHLAGSVGNAVGGFFKGLFGVMAYPFPLLLMGGVPFAMANHKHSRFLKGLIGSILLFLALCSLFQLVLSGWKSGTPLRVYYDAAKNGSIAGGLAGGLVTSLFGIPFGIVGAYILTLAMLFISVIIITQKPLMRYIEKRSRRLVSRARENRKNRAETPSSSGTRRSYRFREASRTDSEGPVSVDLHRLLYGEGKAEKERPQMTGADAARRTARRMDADGRNTDPVQRYSAGSSYGEKSEDDLFDRITFENVPEPVSKEKEKTAETAGKTEMRKTEKRSSAPGKAESAAAPAAENVRKSAKAAGPGNQEDALIPAIDTEEPKEKEYIFPDISLLAERNTGGGDSKEYMAGMARKLENTFRDFGVNVQVKNVSCGPAVTRYELEPEHGVKVSRIVSLTDDIKLSLAAQDIRIEAPIPGKSMIGIEVPNKENSIVSLRELIDSDEFRNFEKTHKNSKLAFAVGRDIAGRRVITDIKKMPHVLIAGATGSGKSVCINTIIMSILYKAKPKEVRLIMIDPKVIELSIYNGIPHLLLPVVTDPKKAAGALNWAVTEMDKRYRDFADMGTGVRNLEEFNHRAQKIQDDPEADEKEKKRFKPKAQIVIIVDELADLMMVAPSDVETSICRLAQLARAAGIHLVVATQRPSVNVITGLIKANMPSRIAFAVTSGIDSRTILDMNGAERLLGKGDMLFSPSGYPKPVRVQGAFVSDDEVAAVVSYLTSENVKEVYNDGEEDIGKTIDQSIVEAVSGAAGNDDGRDEYFAEAGRFIIEKEKASAGMLQRVFKIGFNRAARILDQLSEAGVVSGEEGTKPRRVLMTEAEFEALLEDEGDA